VEQDLSDWSAFRQNQATPRVVCQLEGKVSTPARFYHSVLHCQTAPRPCGLIVNDTNNIIWHHEVFKSRRQLEVTRLQNYLLVKANVIPTGTQAKGGPGLGVQGALHERGDWLDVA
jgi:hypothetical protein